MELTNEFEVAVPVEKAWAVLTDIERIAPCLPGAQLREVEGDEYRGVVKIKVGPITASYDGAIRFSELDELAHRAVMKAEGRETSGQGNVSAVITATLTSLGDSTKVVVATDLTISGKVAQFGRGVLADVSAKLLDQFVVNLESTVLVPSEADAAVSDAPSSDVKKKVRKPRAKTAPKGGSDQAHDGPVPEGGDGVANNDNLDGAQIPGAHDVNSSFRHIDSAPSEPVDLMSVAGGSVVRRLLKPVVIVAALAFIVRRAKRRRK